MRRCRGAGLAALAVLLLVAAVRAQIQQEPFLEIVEGSSITIKCSHPNIRTGDFIHFYRQLPGQRPELVAVTAKAPKEVRAPEGRLSVSADRRSSALWLGRPRRGDAAVYYCALGARAEEPGLRPGTNRRGRGRPGPAGGAAAPPAGAASPRSARDPGALPPPAMAPPPTPALTPAPAPSHRPAWSHRPPSAPLLSTGFMSPSCLISLARIPSNPKGL
ncbi:LOW QUALITY PROTEIN: angiomotin-like [Vidua chalybeata]|uniref:LOW QUALITY PROTEIN: angiomotin-like n=1 Tax=Vidua chalybeata TaxID=81927 RepID=UPI0023A7DCC1|nr:LOW QUALITY PROTEIN: angiomotin-like [Vidua chalybeata]